MFTIFDFETCPLPRGELERIAERVDFSKGRTKEETARANFFDKAALSASTGSIVGLGLLESSWPNMVQTAIGWDEKAILELFWTVVDRTISTHHGEMIGFNSNQFDLRFAIQRSRIHSVPVPGWVVTPAGYPHASFRCLRDEWILPRFYGPPPSHSTLDFLLGVFGIDFRKVDLDGKLFHHVMTSNRPLAEEYLKADIEGTYKLALAMGVGSE